MVRYRAGLVLGMALLATMGCRGVTVTPVPELESAAKAGDRLAPVQVDRVVFNFQRGQQIGAYRGGYVHTGCGNSLSPEPIRWQGGRVIAEDAEIRDVLADELRRAGYNVVGTPDQLFADIAADAVEAEYLIGGRIDGIVMDVCNEVSMWDGRWLGTQFGEISMDVTWQIYSLLDRAVVLETASRGSAVLEDGIRDGEVELLLRALAAATANLAADQKLHALLRQDQPRQAVLAGFDNPRSLPAIALRRVLPPEGSIAENIKRAQASVVTIRSGLGQGSGFFVAPDLILTNQHVVGNMDRVKVVLLDGRIMEAKVLRRSNWRDVALVQVTNGSHAALSLRLARPGLAEEVYAIGSPLDESLAGTITRGIVSQFTTGSDGLDLIQADVTIQPGSSGGPLLDARGQVVGLSQSILADANDLSLGINFFVPIADALNHLNLEVVAD